MRLIALALTATLAIGLLAPGAARADADPASDVLVIQRVFYPYQPPVPAALQRTLNAETAAAARAHFPIKVALVASRTDLGAIPQLFGQPQRYATFLEQEISFGGPQPLLVVMPEGYGVKGVSRAASAAAATLAKPGGSGRLGEAAIVAVRRLAAASGHPLPRVLASAPAPSQPGSDRTIVIVLVALVAVAISSGVIAVRNRPRR
jgi:hypothetical protein